MSSTVPSSGADGVGDTTLFLATEASYASDGPTLPIVGGVGEHSNQVTPNPRGRPTEENADRRPTKKQRTRDDLSKEPTDPEPATKKSKVAVEGLHQPWTLLPVDVSQQIEKRLGAQWKGNVEVVVWTKNQNVKSGINRLKNLLSFQESPESEAKSGRKAPERSQAGLITVSAYGEGTTKLVGIVEMAKRVVGDGVKGGDGMDGETWFAYTILSSTSEEEVKNKVPVLTVWFSSRCVPELKAAFGEQNFKIRQATGAD